MSTYVQICIIGRILFIIIWRLKWILSLSVKKYMLNLQSPNVMAKVHIYWEMCTFAYIIFFVSLNSLKMKTQKMRDSVILTYSKFYPHLRMRNIWSEPVKTLSSVNITGVHSPVPYIFTVSMSKKTWNNNILG